MGETFVETALQCAVCFYGINNESLETVILYFIKPTLEQGISTYICTTLDTELIARMDCHVEKVIVTPYGRKERIAL